MRYLHSTATELYVRSETYNDLLQHYYDSLKISEREAIKFHERNRALNDANASLLRALDAAVSERNRLAVELASLRPPEAKFKVGQIVVRVENGNAFTIRSRRLDPKGGWLWQYTNSRDPYHFGPWYAEKEFRALTPEEIG